MPLANTPRRIQADAVNIMLNQSELFQRSSLTQLEEFTFIPYRLWPPTFASPFGILDVFFVSKFDSHISSSWKSWHLDFVLIYASSVNSLSYYNM